ncbi:nucleoside diphosphate kinase 6 [Anabrus simplex]|uniref:nucleoside diphosphate kinase 6 n=1 Tax=Anabrus simplex TaxID=316456 RepID=UPI0034DD0568
MPVHARELLQLTLAIVKPHVIKAPHALQSVRDTILLNGFYVLKTERFKWSREQAEAFYEEHKKRFFYERLVTFMCSGPFDVHVLARENAVQMWRDIMGPTKVFQAQYTHPETIRGWCGLSDTRNATHGSDSSTSAAREIELFFPNFNISEWYNNEAEQFHNGHIEFDCEEFTHRILGSYKEYNSNIISQLFVNKLNKDQGGGSNAGGKYKIHH